MIDREYDVRAYEEGYRAGKHDAQGEIERLRAALELYRDAVRIDATMEGPKFMGANTSALKRAWDADRAALSHIVDLDDVLLPPKKDSWI